MKKLPVKEGIKNATSNKATGHNNKEARNRKLVEGNLIIIQGDKISKGLLNKEVLSNREDNHSKKDNRNRATGLNVTKDLHSKATKNRAADNIGGLKIVGQGQIGLLGQMLHQGRMIK